MMTRMALAASFLLFGMTAQGHSIKGKVHVKDSSGALLGDASGAVVYIDEVPAGISAPAKDGNYSITSRNKAFVPEILAVTKGSSVSFPNDDIILHNVFSLSKIQTFDLGLYKKGNKKTVTFTKSGVCKVYCNIHEKMSAYIVVLDNPFYAVTREDGNFELPALPNGKYSVSLWHRYGEGATKTVALADGGATLDFEITQEKKTEKHKNKWGKDYDEKY